MDSTEILNRYAKGDREFAGVQLRRADLTEANLTKADLTGARG